MPDIRDNPPLPPYDRSVKTGALTINGRSDDQVRQIEAAAFERGKAAMQGEIERLKTVPMKYRRMEFNAQLQKENDELRAKLKALEEQKPAGVYCVSYYKGIKGMVNTEFQPMMSFGEGEYNLYLAAGAKT